jgi:MFS family permease
MLADQFGTKKIMCIGAIAMIILPYPLSCLLCTKTVTAVIINQLILTIINIVFAGPTLLFKAGLFPTTSRHSALGVGYNLGGAIFGGTSPLICAYLVGSTGNYSLIGFYVAFGGILGLLAICLGKKVDESFEPKTNKTPNLAQLVA